MHAFYHSHRYFRCMPRYRRMLTLLACFCSCLHSYTDLMTRIHWRLRIKQVSIQFRNSVQYDLVFHKLACEINIVCYDMPFKHVCSAIAVQFLLYMYLQMSYQFHSYFRCILSHRCTCSHHPYFDSCRHSDRDYQTGTHWCLHIVETKTNAPMCYTC